MKNENKPLYHNGHLRTAGKQYLAREQEKTESVYHRECGRIVAERVDPDTQKKDAPKHIDDVITQTH